MLSVRDAAKTALNFYKDIYPDISGELIEEVELDEDRKHWLITLSFPISANQTSSSPMPITSILFNKSERKYKIFKVDTQNGSVESMKIRVPGNDPK